MSSINNSATKKLIIKKGGAKPVGPYSPALEFGNLIFISGQIPDSLDADIKVQTRECLEKIKGYLEVSGLNMDDILRCEVYLEDLNDFAEMNGVYAEFFKEPYPTRVTIGGLKIVKNAKIEISAIAGKF
ncbi:MAG: RidA family protein [Promethearchaeota archaeon]